MDLYREAILDHYKHPHNAGTLLKPDKQGHGANPLCGDAVSFTVKLDGDRITDVKFEGEGCAISQASASMLTDLIKEKKVTEVLKLGKDDVLSYLQVELSPSRLKCGVLPLEVLQKAVEE